MPPLCWTTRALGHAPIRRSFQPASILGRASPLTSHRPPSHPRPRFMSASLQRIHERLQALNEDKWGWVIYRTTYKDDAGRDRFKGYVEAWNQRSMAKPDVPPAFARAMDWTFVSDPASTDLSQRYPFFVRVDEDSLNSVLAGNGDFSDSGWVHFIRRDDEMDFDLPLDHKDEELDLGVDVELDQEDDGWMMVSGSTIRGEFYSAIGTGVEFWEGYYGPPPNVMDW